MRFHPQLLREFLDLVCRFIANTEEGGAMREVMLGPWPCLVPVSSNMAVLSVW